MPDLEIWGGIECSVNRVEGRWYDQIEIDGHANRSADLALIASLGIRSLRYPILWERVAPYSESEHGWEWSDDRLTTLQELSIDPIVGLLHHGSGPHYTGLLDSEFPAKLARFAHMVAARYPWVGRYTPINEPLTTARFSALYGHWYPHHRNDRSFARALVNQCLGIALAMRAIRSVNSDAALVQTEDLGTTYCTGHMKYQGQFDNERRWITWDLLCGRVVDRHRLHAFLLDCGISRAELDWFVENPCPPQIIGINHYVTSDRYLDERIGLYPTNSHGRNGRESYADVDAVRVLGGAYPGWRVIREAGERYGLPIALTEVHMGCTREEQLRWFNESLGAAHEARSEGTDVRAVTAWALFGSHNWDKLLTRTDGCYEPGAFDVRAVSPRPTALANLIRKSTTGRCRADGLDAQFREPGWWQLPERVLYAAPTPAATVPTRDGSAHGGRARPLLVCGSRGVLARALIDICRQRNLAYVAVSRATLDNSDATAVARICKAVNPWAIINAAGYVSVDDAEHNASQCMRDNFHGCAALGAAADARKIPFVTFSSDLVFDGLRREPYTESAATSALNVYGRSKVAAEAAILHYPKTLCVRTAAFFGAWNGRDFLSTGLATLERGIPYAALADVTVSPTYLPDLAAASLDMLIDGSFGLLHLVNQGAVTWADFLRCAAERTGIDSRLIRPKSLAECKLPADRPLYSALSSERVHVMPSLDDAIARFSREARFADRVASYG